MSNRLNSMTEWIDKRFPLTSNWKAHLSEYYAPRILISGITLARALLVLVNQLITGIFSMNYKPDASLALLRLNISCVMWIMDNDSLYAFH